ncbi:hypothetical protein SUDANB19_03646 [Streptomyces sp. enrichment culture]
MTETTTTAVEGTEGAAPAPPPPETPPPAPASAGVEQAPPSVAHTPGGYPVLPLALTGMNSTIGLVGAAGLSGGPVAAAGAAAGVALLGAVAAARSRKQAATNRARTTTSSSTPRSTRGPGGLGRSRSSGAGTGRAGSGRGGGAGGGRRAGGKSGGGGGRAGGVKPSAGRRLGSAQRSGKPSAHPRAGAGKGPAGARPGAGAGGRVGQVRALRADTARQAPSRSAGRLQQTRDRRAVADARRAARQEARAGKAAQHGGRGPVGRGAAWAGRKAAAGARHLIDRARRRQDRANERDLAARRDAVRKAPARRAARWALLKSAARFHGRRILAGLLAGTVGVLGAPLSLLGRKLGIPALVHPGRRLYRRLVASARDARTTGDTAIRDRLREAEAAADGAGDGEIRDRVERPTHLASLIPATPLEVRVSGFKFEEAAAEMEQAARTYEPDGNMEVVEMVDNLPQAMESIAKTFLTLAERADNEFAFEKDVANAFDDIYQTLMNAVDAAEDLTKTFRQVHEADIARHEDPRNGQQAEKGWNV